jgi:hypothetical protein
MYIKNRNILSSIEISDRKIVFFFLLLFHSIYTKDNRTSIHEQTKIIFDCMKTKQIRQKFINKMIRVKTKEK